MSSWSRSSYRTSSGLRPEESLPPTGGGREDQSNGWQTVGTRAWGGRSEAPSTSRWGPTGSSTSLQPGSRVWGTSAPQNDMPSAFSKKPRDGGDRPRRITEEEARRDYMMKLAADKARADAEQAKQIADTEDNFPSLGSQVGKRSGAVAAPLPKKSWSAHIISANDEHEQKRVVDEKAAKEAQDKLADGMTVLRLDRKDVREPFFTTGQIETEADFFRNERLRHACFSSSIMAEQEKFDYNQEVNYREDDLDDAPPGRVYSPHSPKYPHSFDDEEEE
jgi:hypothetical protein